MLTLETVFWVGLAIIAVSIGAASVFRKYLIRRSYSDTRQAYEENDFIPSLLLEMKKLWPNDFRVDGTILGEFFRRGSHWWIKYESRGTRRIFYLSKAWIVLEHSVERWRSQKERFYFWHSVLQAVLLSAVAIKCAFRPTENDIRMMIGFDFIAGARQRQQQAEIAQQEQPGRLRLLS